MKSEIIYSTYSLARFKKLILKKPKLLGILNNAIILLTDLLTEHPPATSLKIHKLSGRMKDQWAFSLAYNLRVIFERKENEIWLLNIGSNDEVY